LEFVICQLVRSDTALDQVKPSGKRWCPKVNGSAESASNAVPCHGVANGFSDRKRHGSGFRTLDKNHSNRPTLSSSRGARKGRKVASKPYSVRRHLSDRQLVATLGSAGLQHRTSGTGPHSGPKSVGFSPAAVVWLKRTLHNEPHIRSADWCCPAPGATVSTTTSFSLLQFRRWLWRGSAPRCRVSLPSSGRRRAGTSGLLKSNKPLCGGSSVRRTGCLSTVARSRTE
jgi:hypothetical protein